MVQQKSSCDSGKIFGIGLSRTGTNSLKEAMIILGYNSKHLPRHTEQISRFDFLNDLSIAVNFKWLDITYPGSKFIYTTRDIEPWLDSCEWWFGHGRQAYRCRLTRKHPLLVIWGTIFPPTFERSLYADVYERHDIEVRKYFAKRQDDLLIRDIGDGWQSLCGFLSKPIPNTAFPFAHNGRARGLPHPPDAPCF